MATRRNKRPRQDEGKKRSATNSNASQDAMLITPSQFLASIEKWNLPVPVTCFSDEALEALRRSQAEFISLLASELVHQTESDSSSVTKMVQESHVKTALEMLQLNHLMPNNLEQQADATLPSVAATTKKKTTSTKTKTKLPRQSSSGGGSKRKRASKKPTAAELEEMQREQERLLKQSREKIGM